MKRLLPAFLALACAAGPLHAASEGVAKVQVASGLSRPVFVTHAPGDASRLFIVEQHTGRIRILNLATNTLNAAPFLTVEGVNTGNEQGLLGLAFHPNYASNGYFYVNYTAGGPSRTDIARYRVSADPDTADAASKTVLLTFAQPESNHNGGWIGFGPDGFLYTSTGDGGGANDAHGSFGNAQNRANLLGKILRLDVDGGTPYAIPDGNPYKGHATFREEIWAFGLRNPYRCGFDRGTGDLWIGDVGQGAREEISRIPAGVGNLNFGWRVWEGNRRNFSGETTVTPETPPVYDYPRSDGYVAIGGYVYRGSVMPGLQGTYFFGDYGTGRVWSFVFSGGNVTEFTNRTAQLGNVNGIVSFGEDAAGELYLVLLNGSVHKLVPANPSVSFSNAASAGAESATPANLAVELNAPSSQTVTVDYAVSGGTATGGGTDFTLAAGSLSFSPGQTAKSIALAVANDALDEPDETVVVTLSSPSNATLGAQPSHTYTIQDDDSAPSIAFQAAASSGNEAAGAANLAVVLSAASGRTVTVDYAVTGGTATGGGADYTLVAGTLTFDPGQTAKSIALAVADDAVSEPDETVVVTLSGPSNAALGANASHTYTIQNDDAQPSVAFASAASSGGEAAVAVNLTVSLSNASSQSVTVEYAVTGGTATGGGTDFTLAAGTLTFDPGQTAKNIPLAVVNDADEEEDETLTVTLSAPSNAALGSPAAHTYTIVDDDTPPRASFALPASSAGEDAGAANLAVHLDRAGTQVVTVPYSVTGGTATGGGADYTLAAGNLTFEMGETAQNISVPLVEDLLDEADETVLVTLGAPTHATLGTLTAHTLTIVDNDVPPNFTSTAPTAADVGAAYGYDANATGSGTIVYSLPLKPDGMSIDGASGLIQWTPGADGSFDVTVRASNGVAPDAEQSYALVVSRYGLTARPPAAPYLNMPETENGTLPALLSQTGAFGDTAALTPAAALIPYGVNSPLWSDGAAKTRWISVPSGSTVGFAAEGEWLFPPGTVLVKHFELHVDENDPGVRKRLETRLIVVKADGSVYGVTYKWRADHSDADLLPGGLDESVTIQQAGGGTREQTWTYPSRADCLRCHTPNAGHVLGVKTRQLNGDFAYPSGILDNQLRAWNHAGLFDSALSEANIPNLAKLVAVTDTSATLETRVRSYLDANCAQCHRPGGAPANFDARFDTPLDSQALINGMVDNALGIAWAKVVAPSSSARSVARVRMAAVGPSQMPPLARHVPDADALDALAQWIDSLPPANPVAQFTNVAAAETLSGVRTFNVRAFTPDAAEVDGAGLLGVEFQLRQGANAVAVWNAPGAPYDWTFNTRTAPNGAYVLRATATSLATLGGTLAVVDLAVTIDNAAHAPGVSIVTPPSSPVTVFTGDPVPFLAQGADEDLASGDLLAYAWTFGDGQSGTGASAPHVYAAPGAYTATVTATDLAGLQDSAAVEVIVVDPPEPTDLRVDSASYALNFARALRSGPLADQLTLRGRVNLGALLDAGLDPNDLAGQPLTVNFGGAAFTLPEPSRASASAVLWQSERGAEPSVTASFSPRNGSFSVSIRNAALAADLGPLGASNASGIVNREVNVAFRFGIGAWTREVALGTLYSCARADTAGRGSFRLGTASTPLPDGIFFVGSALLSQANRGGVLLQRATVSLVFFPPGGAAYHPLAGGATAHLGTYVENVGDGSLAGETFKASGATTFTYTRPRREIDGSPIPATGVSNMRFLTTRGMVSVSTNWMEAGSGDGVFGVAPVLDSRGDPRAYELLLVRVSVGGFDMRQLVRLMRSGTSWRQ
ncbi:MAG: PQQ-dependent sugar dehydrogenase [Planctomycetota bacterium]|nr:PQQ-dependent sugar dehydrogenase [Planctomycetota bacterium]